ncbi:glycosyltransferase family 2 protein [Roseicella frigidaeris]|uniref:Glycosyltransferase family 2 protein n=1 Tax=Roseicella frigidaeris TaxID=2230885 RepID=A0A327MCG3_9PROT|nr:glycosyltransferase family 2 protein [Roseicella frigidaeris]RAI60096.1 glycosyltransferase family 2 protein [Roseicella frigidaeris]
MTLVLRTLPQKPGPVRRSPEAPLPKEITGEGPATHPFVTIVVPTLNEAGYIEACLASLVKQWPAAACEILVVDGGSRDETLALVEDFAGRHPVPDFPAIRALPNPQRIQSAAVNLAARLASPRSTILIRADAHARYPGGFVRRCVADLLRTGATSVVVPMRNEAQQGHGLQRAIATAQSSRLGNGGSAHRAKPRSGFVDHGHHAAFDRQFFLSVGGYDESFTHNEDAELDHRAQLAGGRVWMCAEEPVTYFPRKDLPALARQYFKHGAGRARTLLKHRLRPRPRQMAPVAALGCSLGGLLAAPLEPSLALAAAAYPAACLGWGAVRAARARDAWLLAAGPALITMHLSWAAGFLRSVATRGGAQPPIAVPPAAPTVAPAAAPVRVAERYRVG